MSIANSCTGSCFFWFHNGDWIEQSHCSGAGCDCANPTLGGDEGDIAITRCVKADTPPGGTTGGELLWAGSALATKAVPEQWTAFALIIEGPNGYQWQQFPESNTPLADIDGILNDLTVEPGTVLIFDIIDDRINEIIATGRVTPSENN